METRELSLACRTPLESQHIAFQLESATSVPATAARSLLLADGAGRVQLLLSREQLCDLKHLNTELGREFRVVGQEDARAMCSALGVAELPGVPQAIGLPVLVDQTLLNADHVYLPSGHEQQWIRINQEALRQLVKGSEIVSCGEDIDRRSTDDGSLQPIHRAVGQFTQLRVMERLDETLHVPPLPEAARRIIQLQLEPDYDLSDLTQIVETDPALSAQIVGWANSPFYRARSPVSSVDDAIMRVLGFDLVMNLALGLAVGHTLKVPAGHEGGIMRYWLDAVYTAATTEALARCMPKATRVAPGVSYLSGLLSNFGYLILAHAFPPHFQAVSLQRSANRHLPSYLVEQYVLGISGEALAGALLENWTLPAAVHQAVRFQHAPERAGEHQPAAELLGLARQLLGKHMSGLGEPPGDDRTNQLLGSLQLNRDAVDEAMGVIVEANEHLEEMAFKLAV